VYFDNVGGGPTLNATLLVMRVGGWVDACGMIIVRKLEGTHLEAGGTGLRMRMDGGYLEPAEINIVQEWILAGTPKN
jgi:hypothetical protein